MYDGTTPTYIAAEKGHTDCLTALIAAGADVDKAKTKNGKTPMYIAVEREETTCLEILLCAGADVNAVPPQMNADSNDGGGNDLPLPIIEAARQGQVRILAMLLAFGADERVTVEGQTAGEWLWEMHQQVMPLPAPIAPWSIRRHRLFDVWDRRCIAAVLSCMHRPPTHLTTSLAMHILRFTTYRWFAL